MRSRTFVVERQTQPVSVVYSYKVEDENAIFKFAFIFYSFMHIFNMV